MLLPLIQFSICAGLLFSYIFDNPFQLSIYDPIISCRNLLCGKNIAYLMGPEISAIPFPSYDPIISCRNSLCGKNTAYLISLKYPAFNFLLSLFLYQPKSLKFLLLYTHLLPRFFLDLECLHVRRPLHCFHNYILLGSW